MTNNFNADMISFLHLVTRLTPFVYFTINYIYISTFLLDYTIKHAKYGQEIKSRVYCLFIN